MEIAFGPETPVALEPRITKSRQGAAFTPDKLEHRLSIAVPSCVRLAPDVLKDDPETAAFVKRGSGEYSFELVALSCTFHPSDQEPFERAELGIRLQADGKKDPQAIALGMKPLHDADQVEKSNSIKFDAGFKLLGAGPSLSGGMEEKYKQGENFMTAFGLGGKTPYWQFRKTSARKLEGSYRLILVVRRAKSVPALGLVSASAEIRQREWLIPYRTTVTPADSGLRFSIA